MTEEVRGAGAARALAAAMSAVRAMAAAVVTAAAMSRVNAVVAAFLTMMTGRRGGGQRW